VSDLMVMMESAMHADVERLRMISHNLANSSTIGYKREVSLMRPSFESAFESRREELSAIPTMSAAIDHRGGVLRLTGNPLDAALEGDGYFVLAGPSGPVYTRQGNFHLDQSGRLVSSAGLSVMGEGGEIVLSNTDPRVDRDGQIWDGQNAVARLRIAQFSEVGQLEAQGSGLYSAAAGAAPSFAGSVNVRQGFVESANVTAMQEMVRLIETMRHFEMSQRLLKGYDAMTGTALNSLGSL
jgi:flagellar basal-body rod protein FlgF